jgi:hypothetical protein
MDLSKDISVRILLFFVFGSMASFIPVLLISAQMWYIGSAHLVRMIFLSVYVLFFPTKRWLEIVYQLSNFAAVIMAYIFTTVYTGVFSKTADIFSYFYVIIELISIFVNLFFVYFSCFKKQAKISPIVFVKCEEIV